MVFIFNGIHVDFHCTTHKLTGYILPKVRDGLSIITIHATTRAKPNISFRIF